MKIRCHHALLTCLLLASATSRLAGGEVWTLTTAPNSEWTAVGSSTNGNILAGVTDSGAIYTSTNSGAAWTLATNIPGAYWISVCVSANGSNMAAANVGDTIYTSSDCGFTWQPTAAPANYWETITCSADGTRLAAVSSSDGLDYTSAGQIHLSADSGFTWHTPSDPDSLYQQIWIAIASSSDGSRLVAAVQNGALYTSQDFGETWTQTDAPGEIWFSVASSADGNRLAAVGAATPVFLSTNAGVTWVAASNTPVANWVGITSSADGTKLAAAQQGWQIYASSDAGTTWLPDSVPNADNATGYGGITLSTDGTKMLTAGGGPWNGPVYLLQPQPSLTMGRSGGSPPGVTICWPASAAGFVLQQSGDLSGQNWTTVTNVPKMTGGQYQTTIETSSALQYFQLTFPVGIPPDGRHGQSLGDAE